MLYDGLTVNVSNGKLSPDEIRYYIDAVKRCTKNKELSSIMLDIGSCYIDIHYKIVGNPFERIWRVSYTGRSQKAV